ncbi:MAG: flagellar basal body protein [Hyphomicrobium sp.]
MKPVFLFDTLSQNNRWLSQRQSVVAQNVANASTPGYKTRDVKPFSETLDDTMLAMARTDKAHFGADEQHAVNVDVDIEAEGNALHSGNNVGLEREFGKAGDISRSYALNTSILKSFNRMLQLSTKA